MESLSRQLNILIAERSTDIRRIRAYRAGVGSSEDFRDPGFKVTIDGHIDPQVEEDLAREVELYEAADVVYFVEDLADTSHANKVKPI
jgi:hypothetical protein